MRFLETKILLAKMKNIIKVLEGKKGSIRSISQSIGLNVRMILFKGEDKKEEVDPRNPVPD